MPLLFEDIKKYIPFIPTWLEFESTNRSELLQKDLVQLINKELKWADEHARFILKELAVADERMAALAGASAGDACKVLTETIRKKEIIKLAGIIKDRGVRKEAVIEQALDVMIHSFKKIRQYLRSIE